MRRSTLEEMEGFPTFFVEFVVTVVFCVCYNCALGPLVHSVVELRDVVFGCV